MKIKSSTYFVVNKRNDFHAVTLHKTNETCNCSIVCTRIFIHKSYKDFIGICQSLNRINWMWKLKCVFSGSDDHNTYKCCWSFIDGQTVQPLVVEWRWTGWGQVDWPQLPALWNHCQHVGQGRLHHR